jgi:hypothetical protein
LDRDRPFENIILWHERDDSLFEATLSAALRRHCPTPDQVRPGDSVRSNRITTGLVLAALIVGAALLARVETTFKVWGYPVLAIVLFTAAAAGGVILVIRSLWQDSRHEQEVSHPGKPGNSRR